MIRRWRKQKAQKGLLWSGLFLALGFAGLVVAMETWHPELFDVEHVRRMELLQAQLAERPSSALCLVAGSSRLVLGFQPEAVPPLWTLEGEETIVFNYSHFGASPWMTLVELDRLFRSGIRPRWIVLELVPAHLAEAEDKLVPNVVKARELPLSWEHVSPLRFTQRYLSHRLPLSTRYPAYLLGLTSLEMENLCERGGYTDLKDEMDEATRKEKLNHTRRYLHGPISQFRVREETDCVFRHCLRLCDEKGAKVVVILMPEGSELRSWYPPSARRELDEYLRRLEQDHGVEVVDASTWLDDADFYDQHHVLKHGAKKFTDQFAKEVLRPLIATTSERVEK